MKRVGMIKGHTIELDEPLGLPDGQWVEVEVRAVEESPLEKYGFNPILRKRGAKVSNELVNEIREELGF